MRKELNHFVIPIEPKTKKNSQQIIQVHGRPMIIPSKAYREYEKNAMDFLPEKNINFPVNIEVHYFMKSHRKVDLTNLLEATDDILVKAKVIVDDNSNIVVGHDFSRVHYDKENPRTEIIISRMKGTNNERK